MIMFVIMPVIMVMFVIMPVIVVMTHVGAPFMDVLWKSCLQVRLCGNSDSVTDPINQIGGIVNR